MTNKELTVACYTFPHYHPSAVNNRLYAEGWTEYLIQRAAQPWFPGHDQPRFPALGELDEREPRTWETYTALAADHGIDAFIWDWYWFADSRRCTRRWTKASWAPPMRAA
jgi:hypothetical protein